MTFPSPSELFFLYCSTGFQELLSFNLCSARGILFTTRRSINNPMLHFPTNIKGHCGNNWKFVTELSLAAASLKFYLKKDKNKKDFPAGIRKGILYRGDNNPERKKSKCVQCDFCSPLDIKGSSLCFSTVLASKYPFAWPKEAFARLVQQSHWVLKDFLVKDICI